jgi:hypothetical protein
VASAGEPKRARRSGRRILFLVAIPLLLIGVLVLGYGLLERQLLRPSFTSTVEQSDSLVKVGEPIQVNVVNACGVNGMASKFTLFLRARRFDVPEFSTSKGREPFSRVIDRVGDPSSAMKVAYALGIPPEHVETEVDSSLYLRATVVIGEDYLSLRPMK